jgi:hypothetical protein
MHILPLLLLLSVFAGYAFCDGRNYMDSVALSLAFLKDVFGHVNDFQFKFLYVLVF